MPSIGAAAIATILGAKTYTVEGGFNTQFIETTPTVVKLAAAIHNGWTSASPTTPTTMASSFTTEFTGYLQGQGFTFIQCIASGIDDEVAAWVASWDTNTFTHTYTVNAASIINRIMSCSVFKSAGAQAIAESVANAFMAGFGQEAG